MAITEILKNTSNLSDEDISTLLEDMEMVCYSKGERLIDEGQKDLYLYFIEKGLVRSSILRDGKHLTITLAVEGEMSVFSPSLSEVRISKLIVDAIEDCVLWRISRTRMKELFNNSIAFANFGREIVENQLIQYEDYFTEYYSMDKKGQYRLMMKKYPYLLQRVSLGEIASWLNITPQSLSRIRGEID